MSDPYLGEVRMFAGNYAPQDWAFCDGRLLSVKDNDVLFSLIGTMYGGDGRTNFALPDLRGRIPIHMGDTPEGNYQMGDKGGSEKVPLNENELASHTHIPHSFSAGTGSSSPENSIWAQSINPSPQYSQQVDSGFMSSKALSETGGSQSHDNVMPFVTVNYIICMNGIFPPIY